MKHQCQCKRKSEPDKRGRARLTCGRYAKKPVLAQPTLLPGLPVSSNGHLSWEFGSLWNQSLIARPEREMRVRENIWAGEIGGAFIDRYLKMTGVKPSNPPNARSLRKFQAADIWEWVVGFVLKRAGILIDSQEKLHFQYPGLLQVTGKLDHMAGGQPDWEKARAEVLNVGLPAIIENASLSIIKQLSERFGNEPLTEIILEIKSLGSYVFDRYETLSQPAPHHRGQIFHYLKAKPMHEGHVVYICRDDCRIVELGVFNPSDAEKDYKRDIEQMTAFIVAKEQPPKEEEVLFDDLTFRFRTNWHIEYSSYLSLLYGYAEPIHYRERWKSQVSSWNRVFKRCVTGQKMTTKNDLAIIAAKMVFPDWEDKVFAAQEAAQKDPNLVAEEEAEE